MNKTKPEHTLLKEIENLKMTKLSRIEQKFLTEEEMEEIIKLKYYDKIKELNDANCELRID